MKLKLNIMIIFCCAISYHSIAQWEVCPPNRITTNPFAPINNQNPYFENDFFDWTRGTFEDYFKTSWNTSLSGIFPYINPYWSSSLTMEGINGYNTDGSIIDFWPEEGWELIGRNLGKDRNGGEDNELYANVYFILYNKYTGKLRYFYGINPAARSPDAQSYEIKLEFLLSKVNGLLGINGSTAQPLDQETSNYFVKAYTQNNLWWNYVDFTVGYDPCTCLKEATSGEQFNPTALSFISSTITTGNIEMSGRLLGTVASPYFQDGVYDKYVGNELISVFNDDVNVSEVGVETFQRINHLYSKVDMFKQNEPSAFNEFAGLLSAAVSAFPVAEAGLAVFTKILKDDNKKNMLKLIGASSKYASSIVNGLKTEDEEKKALPSIMDGEIALVGKVTSSTKINNAHVTIQTPGTGEANSMEELGHSTKFPAYPFYNEVLGQFAMLTTPTLELQHTSDSRSDNNYNEYNYNVYQLKEDDLEFLFNPALDINFENTSILASLVFEVDKQGDAQYPPVLSSTKGVHDIYLNENGDHVFFTPFIPLECLGNTTASFLTSYQDAYNSPSLHDVVSVSEHDIKNVSLRLMIYYEFESLDRNGIPNAEVQTITFPVNVQETSNALVDGLDGVTGTKVLNTTNFSTSQDIQAFNKIIITGDLTASSGVTVNLIANEVVIQDGASIGSGVNIRIGRPTPCGDVLDQSSINLATYCTKGAYKANILNARRMPIIKPDTEEIITNFDFNTSPNPFKENTQLSLDLLEASEVYIVVYNSLGQEIRTILPPTELKQGKYNYMLDGADLVSGVYYVTIRSNNGVQTKSIIKQ